MESLVFFDQQLFFFINHLPHTALFNFIGLGLSAIGTAGIVWFVLGIFFFIKRGKKDFSLLAGLIFSGISSYIISEKLLKPLFGRIRPIPEMGAIVLGGRTHDFSFPSGHATIALAGAVVLSNMKPIWHL